MPRGPAWQPLCLEDMTSSNHFLSIEQLQVLGWSLGDADGEAGFAQEDNDDAVAADALDFSFYTAEGTAKDADTLADPVEEVAVGELNALTVGIGAVGGFDEIEHGLVGHMDDFGALRLVERGLGHELHEGADSILAFQLFDFALLGMDKDEVAERRHGFVLHGAVLHHPLFGEVQVVVNTLTLQFVAHPQCPNGIAEADAHGIPAQDVVIELFKWPFVFRGFLNVGWVDTKVRSACAVNTGTLKLSV